MGELALIYLSSKKNFNIHRIIHGHFISLKLVHFMKVPEGNSEVKEKQNLLFPVGPFSVLSYLPIQR